MPRITQSGLSWPHGHSASRAVLVAGILLALAITSGCSADVGRYPVETAPVDTSTVDSGGGGGGGGGEVQKARLTITVRLSDQDSAAARVLGWPEGRVPGANLRVLRDRAATPVSATTDLSGLASLLGLLPGSYALSALRQLTEEERQLLQGQGLSATAFGGGIVALVSAPTTERKVSVASSDPGSLVISELYSGSPRLESGNQYRWGHFLEVYNNSDTIVALSDKMFVGGFPGSLDYPNFPCSLYEGMHNDSLGIWAVEVFAFPPNVPPLLPGIVAIVATDAINHAALVSGGFNLSGADAEFRGGGDVDNPAVPNMVYLGPNSGGDVSGHGFEFFQVWEVAALAWRQDLSTLPNIGNPSGGTRRVVRIPADAILDVLTDKTVLDSPYKDCAGAVHPSFDAQSIKELTSTDTRSTQRFVIGATPAGRSILQRTRTSSRDFFAGRPTPFRLP